MDADAFVKVTNLMAAQVGPKLAINIFFID
jgi:hypothetical protein